jgi:hypothetical protein
MQASWTRSVEGMGIQDKVKMSQSVRLETGTMSRLRLRLMLDFLQQNFLRAHAGKASGFGR